MTDHRVPAGATPGDDTTGLLLIPLVTRSERNAVEAEAISLAYAKYVFHARRKKRGTAWLTDALIRQVHREMFGSIWEWGGQYRTNTLNIGMDWPLIPEQIRLLCDDFVYWDSAISTMPVLEVAARLQNRLTKIHPFKNGNGRHARLMTDLFLYSRHHALPQWPQIHLMAQGQEIRAQYIAAMQQADQGNFSELIQFIGRWIPAAP